ncbi:hypothetical protein QR680_008043 [Steinernema hermaphroditum]|uniref:BTB domain-containing protein n=1 Tax=Steinernema hermaphroditum TaxID=289476 RepID=A0AA39IHI6_9BILA|nr:hypothetical protein QR680_008043 [Steinernema hermaphroditum]
MPSTSYGPYTPYGYGPIPPPTFKIGAGRERPKEKASGGSGGSKKSSLQETKEVGKVYVQNIVVTAKMRIGRGAVRQDRDDLNLRVLAMIIPNTQYRPEKFAALRVALRKPHASVNVFRTGQMVCVGARSFEDAKRAIRTVARKIQKIKVTTQEGVQQPRYPELELLYIKVQNIVATVHMGFKIDLDALCADGEHNGNVTYNPEQFTAMTFAIKQPKVSANIFSNGKLNLLGAKSMSDLVNAHEQVATVLNRYRKVSVEEATTKKKDKIMISGTIRSEIDASTEQSSPTYYEIDKFRWCVTYKGSNNSGSYNYMYGDAKHYNSSADRSAFFKDVFVGCYPAVQKRTVLWQCNAKGRIALLADSQNKEISTFWASSYYNFHQKETGEPLNCRTEKRKLSIKTNITILESFFIDLSSPTNLLIEDPSDAAYFAIDGEEVWLSKKVLSFHSPFFYAMFIDDFKEKAIDAYALKEVKLEEIMHFLCILHELPNDITEDSFKYLLFLGDMYQCKKVMNRCEAYLRSASPNDISPVEKLRFANQYNFLSLLAESVKAASVDELTMLVDNQQHVDLSPHARDLILERICFEH